MVSPQCLTFRRIIKDKVTLNEWISRYQGEAGVNQALLLAGGVGKPHGEYESSMSLLETGLFDKANFKNIHIAGHPEGIKTLTQMEVQKTLMQRYSGSRIIKIKLMQKWQ